jgi:hypothetical protein
MAALEQRVPLLRRSVDGLWARFSAGEPLHVDELAALSEAMFRLAVHPRTSTTEAVTLLDRAHQVDGLDPRYPYHLGRIALAAGRPTVAEAWLSLAARLAPDSHRIAAHRVLTYRALDSDRPPGSTHSMASYRDQARELSDSIRASSGDGRECRWSGTHDLELQDGVALPSTARTRDRLLPVLIEIRDLAERRPGGIGAFVVAAVQWMVSGYPASTVRDLLDGLPVADPACAVLRRCTQLCEGGVADLAGELARCVRRGELPDIVVALLHERRLLFGVTSVPEFGVFAAARAFISGDTGSGIADDHITALDAQAARLIDQPPPLGAPADARQDRPLTVEEAHVRLTRLEETRTGLDAVRDALGSFVAGLLVQVAAGIAETATADAVRVDRDAVEAATEMLSAGASRAHEEAGSLLRELGHLSAAELGDAFQDRADAARVALGQLSQIGKFARPLRKIKKVVGHGEAPIDGAQPAPSSQVAGLLNDARRYLPADDADSGTVPSGPTKSPTVTAALERTLRLLDSAFADAWQSLAGYPGSPAVAALRALVRGKHAERCYRLQQVPEATALWQEMLADASLDLATAYNLAVARTSTGTPWRATQAWERYLDDLYLADVACGDLRTHAAERERLHGTIAASYLPAALLDDQPDDADEVSEVSAFLSSRSCVRAAVTHLRLQSLNRRIGYRSPSLATTPAIDDLALLPERVRGRLTNLLASAQPGQVDLEAEKQGQIDAITGTIRLKRRIRYALHTDRHWASSPSSAEVITNLEMVDSIRLDPDDPLTYRSAVAMNVDPDGELTTLNDLAIDARACARGWILRDAATQSRSGTGVRYLAVLRAWVASPIPDEHSEFLDDPQVLYRRSLETLVRVREAGSTVDGDAVADAIQVLRTWQRLLPGATGPACFLAELKILTGRVDEARRLLTDAANHGVHPSGRLRSAAALIATPGRMIRTDSVLDTVHRLVTQLPSDPKVVRLLDDAYQRLLSEALIERRPAKRLLSQLDEWSNEVAAQLGPDVLGEVAALRIRLLDVISTWEARRKPQPHHPPMPDWTSPRAFVVDRAGVVTIPQTP